MKGFTLSRDQIATVAAALMADELEANFDRRVEAVWSADTPLYEGGADLPLETAASCFARLRRFFGCANEAPSSPPGAEIGDWADIVAASIVRRLTSFCFVGEEEREVVHPADAVFADAASFANLLYGRRRILSLAPPHSLVGFTLSALAPNLLQTPAIDARGMAPEELKEFLTFGDVLAATPSRWRYLMAHQVYAPDNCMAVLFGEPASTELSAEIRKAGFGAQREIYGSTELGLIGWRDTPSDPFALFDHWRRRGDDLVRIAPSSATIDVTPSDILQWEGERRFRHGARRDGAVRIGAVNVSPDRIAEKISAHPQVADCEIEVSRHAGGADRLVAMITLVAGGAPPESVARSIDNWCRSKLRPEERPRVYNFR